MNSSLDPNVTDACAATGSSPIATFLTHFLMVVLGALVSFTLHMLYLRYMRSADTGDKELGAPIMRPNSPPTDLNVTIQPADGMWFTSLIKCTAPASCYTHLSNPDQGFELIRQGSRLTALAQPILRSI